MRLDFPDLTDPMISRRDGICGKFSWMSANLVSGSASLTFLIWGGGRAKGF